MLILCKYQRRKNLILIILNAETEKTLFLWHFGRFRFNIFINIDQAHSFITLFRLMPFAFEKK